MSDRGGYHGHRGGGGGGYNRGYYGQGNYNQNKGPMGDRPQGAYDRGYGNREGGGYQQQQQFQGAYNRPPVREGGYGYGKPENGGYNRQASREPGNYRQQDYNRPPSEYERRPPPPKDKGYGFGRNTFSEEDSRDNGGYANRGGYNPQSGPKNGSFGRQGERPNDSYPKRGAPPAPRNYGPSTPQQPSFTPPPPSFTPPPPSYTPPPAVPGASPLEAGECSDDELPPAPKPPTISKTSTNLQKNTNYKGNFDHNSKTDPKFPAPDRHKVKSRDAPRPRSPSVRSRSPPRTPATPRTPSPRTPPPRTPSPRRERKRSRSGSEEGDSGSNTGRSSPKRPREEAEVGVARGVAPHTSWQPAEQAPWQAGVEELFDTNYGNKCLVVRYDTPDTGILRIEGGTDDIIFHVSQVWIQASGSWIQFREAYPSTAMAMMYKPKSRLKLNARKVAAGDYQYQATVVWPEGKAPLDYRTKEWWDDLQRTVSCLRNRVEITAHLSSSSPREAVVQEYISWETGLLRMLDEDKSVALFALENFWTSHEGEFKPLSELDSGLLQDLAPVGSLVCVVVKPLPAHRFSQLRHQAIIVWRDPAAMGADKTMPKEFEERFNSRQKRVEMGKTLVKQHEATKTAVRFDRYLSVPTKPEMTMIPVVLNLLPPGGSAVIKEFDCPENRNIGLIFVTIPNTRDDTKITFYVLFHFEDVVEENGQPVFKDKSVTMKNLNDVMVDLVARSIATADSQADLTKLTQKLNQDYPDAKIPILQAVKVFLKVKGKICTGAAPLPTYLRKEPRSFNVKQPATAFYMGMTLKNNLDIKVLEFIESCPAIMKNVLPNFFNPWFLKSDFKNFIKKDIPKAIPKNMKMLDSYQNSKHIFGEFFAASIQPPKSLPSKLTDHRAKVSLIHTDRQKPRQGLLEVTVDKNKTYVFFSLKSVQCQQKSFGDITNLVRVNMKETLSINAKLVDPKSKIPYVATSVWKTKEDPPRKSGADERIVTEEYKKGTEVIVREWMSRTIELSKSKEANIDDSMKKAEEALSRAEGRDKEKDLKEETPQPEAKDREEARNDGAKEFTWETAFKEKLGQVHKVVNNNFALGVGYHLSAWEEKRFFVLFDTCDVWINNEILQKTGKTMKDVVAEGDHIKFHGVHVDTQNDWNLFYLATAVIVNKTELGAKNEDIPSRGVMKASSAEVATAKLDTFKKVAAMLTKKPVPLDPNVEERKEIMRKKREFWEKKKALNKQRQEEERRRLDVARERADREAQRKAQEMEKKAAARRRALITEAPEVLRELQGMEITRGTDRIYSCKLCGIQAMNLFDAESHIKEEDHKNLKGDKDTGADRFVSREESEEALFLNEFKEIKPETHKGRRVYTCEKCRGADKLPLAPMKKHVMSINHKNNFKQKVNDAQLDQECKEMKKKGRNSISYLCTPCGFTSDSVISTKAHIQEADHIKRTGNYCHACKMFSANKGKFTEHRFSIAHKRKMADLEKPFEEKEAADKEKREKRKQERKEAESKEAEPEVPKEPEDPLKCKVCNFEAEDEDEMKSHNKTDSHRRKYYLTHGKMPSEDGEDEEGEKEFSTLEHMGMVHKAKDIADQAKKSRSLTLDEDVKKQKNEMIEILFKNNIFEKLSESTIKCTTCEVKLQGHAQQKKLYAQLFVHFTSDKHTQRLRVQVKGEEIAANQEDVEDVEAETVPEEGDQEVPSEDTMVVPDPISVSMYQDITDEEALDMFIRLRAQEEEDEDNPVKRMVDIKNKTDNLLYCIPCKTGLMSGKFMARHFESESHKNKVPPAPWRSQLDLSFVLEYGNLFKCLYSNSGFMNLRSLQLLISTREHKKIRADCLNEDTTFDQNIPLDPPRCDICDKYFCSYQEMACHQLTRLHDIRMCQANQMPISPFTDNNDLVDRLAALPAPPPLPMLRSRLANQPGRIAATFESGQFVVIQFVHSDATLHALFDKSRVNNKDRSTFPMVGFPVTFNACKIEPEIPGVSDYIQYWASSVIMGDGVRTDSLGTELTYTQLRREEGGIIDIGLEDAKAELKFQVDTKQYGSQWQDGTGYTVFFDHHPEHIAGEAGEVIIATASCAVILIKSTGMSALLILEDTPLTEIPRSTVEDGLELQPGTEVVLNGVLMDVSKRAQYLATSVWMENTMTSIKRDRLMQAAIEMYHALVLALPPVQHFLGDIVVPSVDMDMDLSGVIDIGKLMEAGGLMVPGAGGGGLVDDDLAAEDDGIAASQDDIAASSESIAESLGEKPKKSFGLKIASFAN